MASGLAGSRSSNNIIRTQACSPPAALITLSSFLPRFRTGLSPQQPSETKGLHFIRLATPGGRASPSHSARHSPRTGSCCLGLGHCAPLNQRSDAGAGARPGQAWVVCTSLKLFQSIQATQTGSMCVLAAGPQSIAVFEEVRTLGSRHRHRGFLRSQTFPVVGLGACVSVAGDAVPLPSFLSGGPTSSHATENFVSMLAAVSPSQRPSEPWLPASHPAAQASLFLLRVGLRPSGFTGVPLASALSHSRKSSTEAGSLPVLFSLCPQHQDQCRHTDTR